MSYIWVAAVVVLLCYTHMGSAETFCQSNANCTGLRQCVGANSTHYGSCQYRSVVLFRWQEGASIAITFVATALAASGGLGGGGALVPVYLLVLGADDSAIPLSHAVIFGASIAHLVSYVRMRHPYTDRPLIDYEFSVLLQLPALAGSIFGVILYALFPAWLLSLLLFILLIFTTIRTGMKAIRMLRAPPGEIPAYMEEFGAVGPVLSPSGPVVDDIGLLEQDPDVGKLVSDSPTGRAATQLHVLRAQETDDEADDAELPLPNVASVMLAEARFPKGKVLVIVLAFVVIVVTSLLKGSSTSGSVVGIVCNSALYWVVLLLPVPLMIVCTAIAMRKTYRRYRRKRASRYHFVQGDIHWNKMKVSLLPVVAFITGSLAAMLGVGGGVIMRPLMLELGMIAQVCVATASFMMVFSAASAAAQFLIFGSLPWDYALLFAIVGLIAAVFGERVVAFIARRSGKLAITVLLISIVLFLSVVLLGYVGISDVISRGFDGFKTQIDCPTSV